MDWLAEETEQREKAVEVLNIAFGDRYHSIAQYLLDAHPYARENERDLLARIRQIADYDRLEAERLATIIEELDGIPQVHVFDHAIVEFNYLSLTFLRQILVDRLQNQLETYETAMASIHGLESAARAMTRLCKALRDQIALLKTA